MSGEVKLTVRLSDTKAHNYNLLMFGDLKKSFLNLQVVYKKKGDS